MQKLDQKSGRIVQKCLRFCSASSSIYAEKVPPRLKRQSIASRNNKIFETLYGISRTEAYSFALKHQDLGELSESNVRKLAKVYQKYDLEKNELREVPELLKVPHSSVRNRVEIYQEIGMKKPITADFILRFQKLYSQPVSEWKKYGLIPAEDNVPENLARSFEMEGAVSDSDSQPVDQLRLQAITRYAQKALDFSPLKAERMLTYYCNQRTERVKFQSARSILSLVRLLRQELDFSNGSFQSSPFTLYADHENVAEMLSARIAVPDLNWREFVTSHPEVMFVPVERVLQILETAKAFGIPGNAFKTYPKIFKLDPEKFSRRLQDLKRFPEIQGFFDNPYILRIVARQTTVKARLELIKQLNFKEVSACVLSENHKSFERFAIEGLDAPKRLEILSFLSKHFDKPKNDIQSHISKHKSWKFISLEVLKKNLNYLTRKFDSEDVFSNCYLLLYPHEKVAEKLEHVKTHSEFSELAPCQQLSMVLYLLELDFNFSGDGVWTSQVVDTDLLDRPEPQQTSDPVSSFGAKKSKKRAKIITGWY